jgi:hypothetical protein
VNVTEADGAEVRVSTRMRAVRRSVFMEDAAPAGKPGKGKPLSTGSPAKMGALPKWGLSLCAAVVRGVGVAGNGRSDSLGSSKTRASGGCLGTERR